VTAVALGEHYQAMVQGPTAAELTSEGYLAPARVLAPPGFDSAGLRKRMGDFDTKQAEQRVGTIMGDCLGALPQTPIRPDGDRLLLQQLHMQRQWRICSSRQVSLRQVLTAPWMPALGGSCWQTASGTGRPQGAHQLRTHR
jgi:hypothetical protein